MTADLTILADFMTFHDSYELMTLVIVNIVQIGLQQVITDQHPSSHSFSYARVPSLPPVYHMFQHSVYVTLAIFYPIHISHNILYLSHN